MNKQALSSLSVEQLRQCKQNLAKRIDDLKFFNLDLGRANLSLAEEYRDLRQKAEKVKQGKMPKLNKAKGYHKNIYLEHESKPRENSYFQIHGKIMGKQVNVNNFNFNDLYKMSKSKISNWIGGKGKKQEEIQLPNQRNYHQNYSQHQNYGQPEMVYYQHVIVGDFPPAEVMKIDENIDFNPLQQNVWSIVKQRPVIKTIDVKSGEKDPIQQEITQIIRHPFTQKNLEQSLHLHQQQNHSEMSNYQRLYHPLQNDQYIQEEKRRKIYEHQQLLMRQQEKYQKSQVNKQHSQPQSHTKGQNKNMKNFEFDDLPGLGWKKLKGLFGWGSKNKKEQANKTYEAPTYQEQAINQNLVNYQAEIDQQEINSNPIAIAQRKRTPIFGSSINQNLRESQQQVQNELMKQARIQKQIIKEEPTQRQVDAKSSFHPSQEGQLEVQSKIEEKQGFEMKKNASI